MSFIRDLRRYSGVRALLPSLTVSRQFPSRPPPVALLAFRISDRRRIWSVQRVHHSRSRKPHPRDLAFRGISESIYEAEASGLTAGQARTWQNGTSRL
jgi:hypothetical protein